MIETSRPRAYRCGCLLFVTRLYATNTRTTNPMSANIALQSANSTASAAPSKAAPATAEDPFYIAATQQPTTRPPRSLKYGDTFIVFDNRGDIEGSSDGATGLFHQDTRHLSR